MAVKIYMTNFKGGTGVTTCAVGLALALAKLGERTLIWTATDMRRGRLR